MIAENVPAGGHYRQEALLLAEQETVDIQFASDQLSQYLSLQKLELVRVMGGQLNIYDCVEQRLLVSVHVCHYTRNILKVAFGSDGLLKVVGVVPVQTILIVGVADNFPFFYRCDMAGIDLQGNAVLFTQVAQNRLFFRGCRVLAQGPDTAVCVATDKIVREKPNHGRRNHI